MATQQEILARRSTLQAALSEESAQLSAAEQALDLFSTAIARYQRAVKVRDTIVAAGDQPVRASLGDQAISIPASALVGWANARVSAAMAEIDALMA